MLIAVRRAASFSAICVALGLAIAPAPAAGQATPETNPATVFGPPPGIGLQRSEGNAPPALDLYLRRLRDTIAGDGPLAFPEAFPALRSHNFDDPDARIALYARARPGADLQLTRAIEALGGAVTPIAASVLAVRLPPAALWALGQLPSLARAEASLPRRPLLDVSVPLIGADRVQAGDGLALPLTGRGVILGLVDTGLDFRHLAFNDAEHRSRVIAIWDQTTEGTPPPGYTTGDTCDAASITEGTCTAAIDVIGHGTHVAATAGGRDRDYGGVAPEVRFVVAKSLSFTLLGESAKFIFDTADALGEPAVINMSLGGHYGAHDGTSLEEQALDALTGPGHLLAIAAGNEGSDRLHLGARLAVTPIYTVLLVQPGFGSDGGFIDLWFDKGGFELELAVRDARDAVIATTGFHAAGDPVTLQLTDASGGALGQAQIAFAGANPANGRHRANLLVVPSRSPDTTAGNPAGRFWVLGIRSATGSNRVDAWIASSALLGGGAAFGPRDDADFRPGDSLSTVAMPGTAARAITVGALTSRSAWTDRDGLPFEDLELQVGALAAFSSVGPTGDPDRTGWKPEIVAPGEWVAAPFGHNAVLLDGRMLLEDDVVAMRGTSMATPHVAGVLALLLEADPTLGPTEAETILARTAISDTFTGTVPNDRWGFGKLDAWAAALHMVGPAPPPPTPEKKGCGCATEAAPPAGTLAIFLALGGLGLLRWRRWPW